MIYLSVSVATEEAAVFRAAGIGVMLSPASGVRLGLAEAYGVWAADNGCYTAGDRFDLDAYLAWLAAMARAASTCLFATAPDVVGDAAATWARSAPVLPRIRALGYPAALVAQDGWDSAAVDWAAFDALFIGGTDAFKLSSDACGLIAAAKGHHKHVHVGRVNSWLRLLRFVRAGADSADGTTLAFNRHRYGPEIRRWGVRRAAQRSFWKELA